MFSGYCLSELDSISICVAEFHWFGVCVCKLMYSAVIVVSGIAVRLFERNYNAVIVVA